MLPGICPERNNQCAFFTDLCRDTPRTSLQITELKVVDLVHAVAAENPCSEIRIDEDGPIDPVCAAKLAASLIVIYSK